MITDEYLLDYMDGLLTDRQRVELEEIMFNDIQLKCRYEALLFLNRELGNLGLEKPGPDFEKNVMKKVNRKVSFKTHLLTYLQIVGPFLFFVFIFTFIEIKEDSLFSLVQIFSAKALSFLRFGVNGLFILGSFLIAIYFQTREWVKVW